jgi:hypothetical protein
MVRTAIVLALLLGAALPAPAFAEDIYYVRNDTRLAFTCGLRREPTRKVYRFLLRSGHDHSQAMAGGRERSLLCDSRPLHTQRFRMRSGVRYALVMDHEGVVALRPLAAAP